MSKGKLLLLRAAVGFGVGLFVCFVYFLLNSIPWKVWDNNPGMYGILNSQTWFWPSSFFAIVFRELPVSGVIAIIWSLNGLLYAAISFGLAALQGRPVLYALLVFAILAAFVWFHVSFLQEFSWLWFVVTGLAFAVLGYIDFRRSTNRRSEQGNRNQRGQARISP
jgi:hypothetical protein